MIISVRASAVSAEGRRAVEGGDLHEGVLQIVTGKEAWKRCATPGSRRLSSRATSREVV